MDWTCSHCSVPQQHQNWVALCKVSQQLWSQLHKYIDICLELGTHMMDIDLESHNTERTSSDRIGMSED